MCKFWNKLTGNYSSSAKVVDDHLVLSLPDAISPVVWRMELVHVKASALEIRAGKEGLHNLILKTPKGDLHDIAPFDRKAKALKALMAVSEAMESGSRQTYTLKPEGNTDVKAPSNSAGENNNHGALKWAAAFIGVFIVTGMIVYLGTLTQETAGSRGTKNTASTLSPASGKADETGVPLSADAYLGGF